MLSKISVCVCVCVCSPVSPMKVKDTVATDKEDDKVHTDDHPGKNGTTVRHDTVIHDYIPVLTSQDLHTHQ